jgi:hypothetical protein
MALAGGIIEGILMAVFGSGRNVIKETAEVFRENAESSATRDAAYRGEALQEFGQEFALARLGWFDRFMDGLNRVPRPALALGTIGLFVSAMVNPVWFASRMQGIALVPEPLWWLMGAIVSFYFGARAQAKGQEFQRSISETMARANQVSANIRALEALNGGAATKSATQEQSTNDNAALNEWREQHAG